MANKLTEMWYLWSVAKKGWTAKQEVEELNRFMEKFIGTYNRRNLRVFQSLQELYADITAKIGDDFAYVQSIHGLTTMMCTIYQIILFSTLAEGRKEFTADYLKDITTLLSSCENAESAEIPVLLEEIASTLLRCNSAKAHEFCDVSPDQGIAWLTKNCITAYSLFEAFIERHKHRGFQEVRTLVYDEFYDFFHLIVFLHQFDFGYETWGMNPSLVIEMLQKTIRNRKLQNHKKRTTKRTNDEILAELKTPTKSSTT